MTETTLERALGDLGRHLAWPEAPDLGRAVRAELEAAPVLPLRPGRLRRRRWVVVAAAAVLALGGLLAVSPGLRAALLELLRLPGARIEIERTPSATPTVAGSPALEDLVPGERASLSEARRLASFEVLVPRGLGRPDEVVVFGAGEDAVVTLAWRAGPGLPGADATGYGAVLTEFRARPADELIRKLATEAQVQSVVVNGERGYWIEGPHPVLLRRDGSIVEDRPRLSASSLLWTSDGLTLRLEADISLTKALGLASRLGIG